MTDSDDLSTTGADPTSELIVAFVQKAQALFLAGGVEVTLQAVLDLAVGPSRAATSPASLCSKRGAG
jgi:hypothetical protein